MNNESSEDNIRSNNNMLNRDNLIGILCHTASMPGRTLLVADHKLSGVPFRIPYSHTYDPITFSFYADANLDVRKYFDIWQSAVINITDNSMNFWDEYTSNIKIYQLNRAGKYGRPEDYWVELYECYPMTIGEMSYGYANSGAVQTVTVTMHFRLWKANHDQTAIYGSEANNFYGTVATTGRLDVVDITKKVLNANAISLGQQAIGQVISSVAKSAVNFVSGYF